MTSVYNSEPSGEGSFAYAFQEAAADEEITFTPGGSFAIAAFPEIDKPVKLKGGGATIAITGPTGLRIASSGVEIRALSMSGGDYCIAGVCPGLVLEDVDLSAAQWNCLHFGNSPGMAWTRLAVHHALDSGVELFRGCDGTVIEGFHSYSNGRFDVALNAPMGYGVMNHSNNVTAKKSVVEGSTRTGWLNYNCEGVLLEDSDFRGNAHSGINNDGQKWPGAQAWRPGCLFEPDYEDTGNGQCSFNTFRFCRLGGDPLMFYRNPNGKMDLLFHHARDMLVEGCDIFGHKNPNIPAYHGICVQSPVADSLHSARISIQGNRLGISRKNQHLTGDGFAIYIHKAYGCEIGNILPNSFGADWQGICSLTGQWSASHTYSAANNKVL